VFRRVTGGLRCRRCHLTCAVLLDRAGHVVAAARRFITPEIDTAWGRK
jgi:hypothetical protein